MFLLSPIGHRRVQYVLLLVLLHYTDNYDHHTVANDVEYHLNFLYKLLMPNLFAYIHKNKLSDVYDKRNNF